MKKSKDAAEISPVMRTLAHYIAGAGRKPLPQPVLEKTRHHVLDTFAAMVSGSKLLPGKMALRYVKTLGGKREATVVGSRFMTNVVNAALANAMQAHADETDDSHAPSASHPGCGIVSAALAMAERGRCDGMFLLRAVALGYDVSSRLNIALGAMKFRKVGHMTHCFGPTFESAHDQKRMKDPRVREVRSRIELIGDDELDKLLPERQGIVDLTLRDGRRLRHHTRAVRGTALNPMTRAEVDEKCYHLMAPVLGQKRARSLCDTVWSIERLKDARKLRPLLQL